MNLSEILRKCDHTLLDRCATWEQIKEICDDGMKYNTASVCIPSSYVKAAKEYVGERLAICTVIGFPNGYSTAASKIFECRDGGCFLSPSARKASCRQARENGYA